MRQRKVRVCVSSRGRRLPSSIQADATRTPQASRPAAKSRPLSVSINIVQSLKTAGLKSVRLVRSALDSPGGLETDPNGVEEGVTSWPYGSFFYSMHAQLKFELIQRSALVSDCTPCSHLGSVRPCRCERR